MEQMTTTSDTLSSYLLSSYTEDYRNATQSDFLQAAAKGTLSRGKLSQWLSNDRLYIHEYIKAIAKLLTFVNLSRATDPSEHSASVETRLVDWLIDALVNIRREEKFFLDVARRYGLDINLPEHDGQITESLKLPGLIKFERLFKLSEPSEDLPWLEGAVILWGTEKCYLDAWSWAKSEMPQTSASALASQSDGGALREEFIPNWTGPEFTEFVSKLQHIIDDGIAKSLEVASSRVSKPAVAYLQSLYQRRAAVVWEKLLDAETSFWPEII